MPDATDMATDPQTKAADASARTPDRPAREIDPPQAADPPDPLARAAELRAAGRPFALATVVAVTAPTSARAGARGLVHPDGRIEGWVGGSCAQPVVVREALRALRDGEPRLLRLSREGPSDSRRGGGIVDYVMTCHSGGALEIFVEPHLPKPELWICGTTPIAHALAELGTAAGYAVTVVDPVAEADVFPSASRVVAQASLDLEATAPPFVVVVTQGGWDEEALASALRREVAYVGLVASPPRAAAVRGYLADVGVPEERIALVRSPAGLDLGAETPHEVAISILAELVQLRRARHPDGPVGRPMPAHGALEVAEGEALDPVCGMSVDRATARHVAEHAGELYYFCSVGCRTRFARDPLAYVAASPTPGA